MMVLINLLIFIKTFKKNRFEKKKGEGEFSQMMTNKNKGMQIKNILTNDDKYN